MLALVGTNIAAGLVFAALYVAAGTSVLSQPAFLAALVVFFVALTAVWLRVERGGAPGRRLGGRLVRIAAGLAMALVGVPGLVLMPLFALREQIPVEAGFDQVLPGMMVATLAATILMVGMNVVGTAWMTATALRRGAGVRP